jgi:hypothetical protein
MIKTLPNLLEYSKNAPTQYFKNVEYRILGEYKWQITSQLRKELDKQKQEE